MNAKWMMPVAAMALFAVGPAQGDGAAPVEFAPTFRIALK